MTYRVDSSPLYVAFLWHMHQPYYRDPITGVYRLPWVMLHGTKDYYGMAAILKDFPLIHQTFNLVPSLLEQLLDYVEGRADDIFFRVSHIPSSELTLEHKIFILSNFFLANWDNMIKPFPRYYELLVKRGRTVTRGDLERAIKYFSTQDFLDLQVFFNLCWFDRIFMEKDLFVKGLIQKGKNYTEDEKKVLLNKQKEILGLIIPEYRKMKEQGQIEITTSPFYHPILPLLYDTNLAKIALPHIRLPQLRFSSRDDVLKQIKMAVDYHEKLFGSRPEGMWPSEGSVSAEIINAFKQSGIKWIATDEGILERSMGISLRDSKGAVKEPRALYQPYIVGDGLSIIFRDHEISDLIGFVYHKWDAKKSADDLIQRLYRIKHSLPNGKPFLVPIILDGENAWEHYQKDGRDFLHYLYERLSREDSIRTVTVSEYLKEHPPVARIENLFPGSWINSNFSIWIGHEEDNLAWDMLTETREELSIFSRLNPDANLEDAWKSLYIAEGSDWCWWYGDEHTTETQAEFDELFRANLAKVYKVMEKDVPLKLLIPIVRENRSIKPTTAIRGFITPQIDGEITSYYEWYQSAYLEVSRMGGTMHIAESLMTRIYYGFDANNLYLRVDAKKPL
ncbi:MAG TPA: glycoside hydrolase family 57, partial [Nitrospiraceae bacterium]|nr:glycoside hydrolase family 57 [Nitrospiraceae bacterium]